MLLHCRIVPRFRFPISTSNPPPPSLCAHRLLFPHKRTVFASPFSHFASFAPRSHLAVPVSAPSESFLDTDEDHQIKIPLEKLFVPPEVELPEGSAAVAALGRVLKGSNIVLGPYARDAQVTTADFVKSSVRTEDCPADGLPEFALVGRSNVGKSSLLNSLVRRKRLALTSKKPGKTQCINHFRINDTWYLVDLPGYG